MPQRMDYSNAADSYIDAAEEESSDNAPTWMLKDHGSTGECKQSRLLFNNIMFLILYECDFVRKRRDLNVIMQLRSIV